MFVFINHFSYFFVFTFDWRLSFFFFKIIFFIQLTCICSILDRCVSYTFWCCTIVSCCSFTSFLYCTSTTRPFPFWKRKYLLFCFYFWLKTVLHYTLLFLHNPFLLFFFKIIFIIQLTCICFILDRCVSYTFWCCTTVRCCSFISFLYCTNCLIE